MINCVAGPSRIIGHVSQRAVRHASSAATSATSRTGKVPEYAAFLPASHPESAHSNSTPRMIIEAAARGSAWGWYSAKKDRGMSEDETLRDMARQQTGRPSPVQQEFDAAGTTRELYGDGALEDDALDAVPLGSIMEIRRSTHVFHACLIGRGLSQVTGLPVLRSIVTSGLMLTHKISDIVFTVPSYFPRHLVEAAGAENMPCTKSEENARLAIIRRLMELTKDVEKTSILIVPRASRLYELFRSPDPNNWSALSVIDAARYIDGTNPDLVPSTRTIFAAHKYLFADPVHFLMDPLRHRVSQTFSVRPANDANAALQTQDWSMSDAAAIERFVRKAVKIVRATQGARRPSGPIEPFSAEEMTKLDLPSFDADDAQIIRSLQMYVERTRFTQTNPVEIITRLILRDTGLYENETKDRALVAQLLERMGINTPWKDLTENRILVPRRTQEQTEAFERDGVKMLELREEKREKLKEERKAGTATPKTQKSVLLPKDLRPEDDCEAVRHDFGSLPMLVIDDPSAQELDDGISVERIEGTTDVRIHVHIADPTRLLHPENVFAREARARAETVYLVEQTVRMLPFSLVSAGLTLEPGKPVHTVTFSARVDEEGKMSEWQVRAGLVRNVIRTSYRKMNEVLGVTPDEKPEILKLLSTETVLPDTQRGQIPVDTARLMFETMFKLRGRRTARDWFTGHYPRAEPRIVTPLPLPEHPRVPSQSTLYHGFPRFDININKYQDGSVTLVSEYMLAAGQIAGKWAHERGIPLIYRGSESPIASPIALAEALTLRDANNAIYMVHLERLAIKYVPVKNAVEPIRHYTMGISHHDGGYSRITSPLRRYLDMVNHWQLKAAIARPSLRSLPFTKEDLETLATEQGFKATMLRKQAKDNARVWMVRLLWQALYTDEYPAAKEILLRTGLEAHIGERWSGEGNSDIELDVVIPGLGMDATCEGLTKEQAGQLVPGQEVWVRVTRLMVDSVPRLVCQLIQR